MNHQNANIVRCCTGSLVPVCSVGSTIPVRRRDLSTPGRSRKSGPAVSSSGLAASTATPSLPSKSLANDDFNVRNECQLAIELGRVHTNYGIIGVNGDHCGAVQKDQG